MYGDPNYTSSSLSLPTSSSIGASSKSTKISSEGTASKVAIAIRLSIIRSDTSGKSTLKSGRKTKS